MRMLGLAASAMLVTAITAAPREAQAGTRFGLEIFVGHHGGYEYGEGHSAYRAGYERGYREGAEHGDRDADHHRGFDFDHDNGYRCADAGYHGYYGPKAYYQAGFRRAYEIGYRRAYASRNERERHYGRRDDDHRDRDQWLDRGYERRDRDWDDR
jgi:hypothetical protein